MWSAWMLRNQQRIRGGEGWLACLLVSAGAFKLWLAARQPQFALPAAPYDDRIFLSQASHLLEGNWLGAYDRFTLVKGPFYAMFMAGASLLHLPLMLAHNLVYLVAGWLLVRALRPLQLPVWFRAVLLVAILLCPAMADTATFVRAWRQALWPGLVLLAVAGALGLAVREKASTGRQVAWALLAGGAAAALWLTREEAVWALPMLLLPLLVAAWRARVLGRRFIRWSCLLMPAAVAVLLVSAVAWKNFREYGFGGIVEFRDEAFVSAYSSLCRVKPHDADRRIPITFAARENIYRVSPLFASLRNEIEGGIGAIFMKVTQDYTGIPAAEHQIGGGWMSWTLRDAVANTGHAGSALEARAFYRQLAREVNTACDEGRLEALPRRHSMMSPWHKVFFFKTWESARSCYNLIVTCPADPEPVPSVGSPEDLAWVERVTHQAVTPSDAGRAAELRSPRGLYWINAHLAVYRASMPWLLPLAVVVWLGLLARTLYLRQTSWSLVMASALALGSVGNVVVVALVDATSYPAVVPGYLGASIPLAVCFVGAVFAAAVLPDSSFRHIRQQGSP